MVNCPAGYTCTVEPNISWLQVLGFIGGMLLLVLIFIAVVLWLADNL